MGLVSILILGGCTSTKTSKAPKIDAQKKVISTYLEGLRDSDRKKVLDSLNYSLAQQYVGYPEQLTKMFTSQKANGSIQGWTFQDDTIFLDEVNNQTIVTTTVKYPTFTMDIKFDLRRADGQWMVFGTEVVKQQSTEKEKGKAKGKAPQINDLKEPKTK